jgi:hypothetical protein
VDLPMKGLIHFKFSTSLVFLDLMYVIHRII